MVPSGLDVCDANEGLVAHEVLKRYAASSPELGQVMVEPIENEMQAAIQPTEVQPRTAIVDVNGSADENENRDANVSANEDENEGESASEDVSVGADEDASGNENAGVRSAGGNVDADVDEDEGEDVKNVDAG